MTTQYGRLSITDCDGDALIIDRTQGGLYASVRKASGGGTSTAGPFMPERVRAALDAVAPVGSYTRTDEWRDPRDEEIERLRGWIDRAERFEARAEKAEEERDDLREQLEAQKPAVIREHRPLTPDAITDEMVERARSAWLEFARTDGIPTPEVTREMLAAALTEPPARPEGAEEVAVRLFQAGAAVGVEMTAEQRDALADHLAAMHVRVVAEEDPR